MAAEAAGPMAAEAAGAEAPAPNAEPAPPPATLRFDLVAGDREHRIGRLIEQMTLSEKIGQLVQLYPPEDELTDELAARIRAGEIGSIFYPGNAAVTRHAQRIAIEESRLGVPLLVARDVVHGLRTVFPIPLGQAATWNPELVEQAARVAALESRSEGINWTFAPMVDICRDARWGRIAETLGEDPLLAGDLAAAMVRGFQMESGGRVRGVVACAKHFVGYGFSEGGRDYNRVSVSAADLHNVILPPFKRSVDAGCRTLMTSFSELNGVPGTAHTPLLRGTLKGDWGFSGFVVSDWGSIAEMVTHGYSASNRHATHDAIMAGVDMDMCSALYAKHLHDEVNAGRVPMDRLDDAVRRVLRCKAEAAGGHQDDTQHRLLEAASLEAAREAARQSVVLLKNDGVLPLDAGRLKTVAVIGPMADAPKAQLGCWSLDGKAEDSVTPLAALREQLAGRAEVVYARGAANTFAADRSGIEAAVAAAERSDVALLFLGEDAVLSGEARSRSSIQLPGVQPELVRAVAETGKPVVLVLLTGRPLAIAEQADLSDAVMLAWHPGTMAGPALADLLLGDACPSGKLPVTIPRSVGQTPIYYNHPNTGRPSPAGYRPLVGTSLEDLPPEHQYRSHYLDEESGPLFPFGYGLSYASFDYSGLELDRTEVSPPGTVRLGVTVANSSARDGVEVVQLYLRDTAARQVRPVRELKAYRRVPLAAGQSARVEFELTAEDLSYANARGDRVLEPGEFQMWIGGDSAAPLTASFTLREPPPRLAPAEISPPPTASTPRQKIR
ncbi:MAG: glycoside hydrolase family 3 N-terminal domain-containing protein [Planctomycetota bacterium]